MISRVAQSLPSFIGPDEFERAILRGCRDRAKEKAGIGKGKERKESRHNPSIYIYLDKLTR